MSNDGITVFGGCSSVAAISAHIRWQLNTRLLFLLDDVLVSYGVATPST